MRISRRTLLQGAISYGVLKVLNAYANDDDDDDLNPTKNFLRKVRGYQQLFTPTPDGKHLGLKLETTNRGDTFKVDLLFTVKEGKLDELVSGGINVDFKYIIQGYTIEGIVTDSDLDGGYDYMRTPIGRDYAELKNDIQDSVFLQHLYSHALIKLGQEADKRIQAALLLMNP